MTRICLLLTIFSALMTAQAKADGDTIVFSNGDKLAGHFVKADGGSVTFKSDILGEVKVDWAKVKELHTNAAVAVIPSNVKLRKRSDVKGVPQGTLAMENQTIELTPAKSIPVKDVQVVVDQAGYQKAISSNPGFFNDWKGAATFGASLVEATQNSRAFNGSISMARTEPSESWIAPSDRTSFDFAASYGEVTQPNTPTVKTSIIHADFERDQYFSSKIFGFGAAAFDHNFSQGLDLQQTYNGGIGWTVVNTAKQTFNVRGSVSYIRQEFANGTSLNLIGSVFGEDYLRKLPHGMIFTERGTFTPAWNNTNAYSAAVSALLSWPVYKRLGGSTGIVDTYLNNPPAGFKNNSFQFTVGLSYSLQ